MRIRTRYKLFKLLMLLGVIVFAVSLYDMFANKAEWFPYVFIAFAAVLLFELILYIGHKPSLEGGEPIVTEEVTSYEAPPTVEEVAVATEVVEVPKSRRSITGVSVEGPHNFRCPFCSNVFALEATHLDRTKDFRMNCPYCANNIKVPKRPAVSPGRTDELRHAAPSDQVLYACTSCGEVLRFTAPQSKLERALFVRSCPHCGRTDVALAALG